MKLMPLRYAGSCATCGVRIEQRAEAWYDPSAKQVTCTTCRPVDAQLSVDTAVDTSPPPPMRAARTDLQKGTELEQKIADVFAANGYRVETNVIREGRSGASHEVDVLAEKTDDLLTLSVAVECKAWANPIEKDVIAKFNEVRRDLGLGHALVVSLNGARAGATTLAEELGVVVWGRDEIERHFGKSSVLGLQNRPMVAEIAVPRQLDTEAARSLVDKATGGRFGMGKEEVVWQGPAWLPIVIVQLTLRKYGPFQRKVATTPAWAAYDLIGGTFVTRLDEEPARIPVDLDGPKLDQLLKLTQPGKALETVIDKWNKVSSDSATQKYRSEMDRLGVPENHTATVGVSSPFLYPVHLALARSGGAERIVAVDAFRCRLDDDLGLALSKQIAAVRPALKESNHEPHHD